MAKKTPAMSAKPAKGTTSLEQALTRLESLGNEATRKQNAKWAYGSIQSGARQFGVKHGDIQVLGAASYSAPLLSTAILVATGYAAYSHTLLVACLLITAGAVLAASDLLFRRR